MQLLDEVSESAIQEAAVIRDLKSQPGPSKQREGEVCLWSPGASEQCLKGLRQLLGKDQQRVSTGRSRGPYQAPVAIN